MEIKSKYGSKFEIGISACGYSRGYYTIDTVSLMEDLDANIEIGNVPADQIEEYSLQFLKDCASGYRMEFVEVRDDKDCEVWVEIIR